jgi:hypothetical protein
MKHLLFILLLVAPVACSKVKSTEVAAQPQREPVIAEVRTTFERYSPLIDTVVAFLWPERIDANVQREALRKVIRISRELREQKDAYLEEKDQIQQRFRRHHCDCVLNSDCTGDEGELDQNLCYEIEDEVYAHAGKLIPIMELVDQIKLEVANTGGEWLETHLDFPELPSSSFDFEAGVLSLSVLGLSAVSAEPIAYESVPTVIFQERSHLQLTSEFPRSELGGSWRIDAGISPGPYSLTVQGELFWTLNGKTRRGVITWEHQRLGL